MSNDIPYKIPDEVQHVRDHKNITERTGLANYLAKDALVQEYVSFDREVRKKFLKDQCTELNKKPDWIYFNYAGTGNNSKVSMTFKSGDYKESISTGTSIVFGILKDHWNTLRSIIIALENVPEGKDNVRNSYANLKKEICKLLMSHIYTAVVRLGTNRPVIGHLFYVKKIEPKDITPASVGLNLGSAKNFTAVEIKKKTLDHVKFDPVYSSIKEIFDQIDNNPTRVLIKLDLSYVSEIKSETMEIFSAYYALKNYRRNARVQFPIKQIASYDYILVDRSLVYVSVKNQISAANALNNTYNKNANNSKTIIGNTNTIKIKDIFPTDDHLTQWYNQYNPKHAKKHENVEKILKPAVNMGSKYGSYPILATRNLFGNNANNNHFVTYLKQIFNSDDTNIIKTISKIIIECINIYDNSIDTITITNNVAFIQFMKNLFKDGTGNTTYFNYVTDKKQNEITFETSYIRYICERIIEKASQNDELANFIDVFIDYMYKSKYNLDKKPVFCIAKSKVVKNKNSKELYMYFRYYNYKTMNQKNLGHGANWISLRCKLTKNLRTKESLGLDPKILDDIIDTHIKASTSPSEITMASLFRVRFRINK